MEYGYNVICHLPEGQEIYRVEPDGAPAIEGAQSKEVVYQDCTEAMGAEYLHELWEVIGGSLTMTGGLHCLTVARGDKRQPRMGVSLPETDY